MELLYESSKLRIGYNPRSHEDHILYIGLDGAENERAAHIQRGILEELAETLGIPTIELKVRNFNEYIIESLEEHAIPFEELALAFAQARIKEVENERDNFIGETLKLKGLR